MNDKWYLSAAVALVGILAQAGCTPVDGGPDGMMNQNMNANDNGDPTADRDDDGIVDVDDNCPDLANEDQADCDGDGVGDACALAGGTSDDCDESGLPDQCDVAPGSELAAAIAAGESLCDQACLADINADGEVTIGDQLTLLGQYGECPQEGECPSDLDGDGIVGDFDGNVLSANFGQTCEANQGGS